MQEEAEMDDNRVSADTIRELLEFFFEGMQEGYVRTSPKVTLDNLLGSRCIRYERDDLLLADFWFVRPHSNASHGMTVISREGIPAWAMHYGGRYDGRAIPFLKRALEQSYSLGIFMGGRGLRQLEGDDHTLQYINTVEYNGFDRFRGHERIIATSEQTGVSAGQELGEHSYFGGLMF